MPEGYSFRPRAWPLLLAALACAAGVALGHWQSGRAQEKRALAASQERVRITGTFVPEHTVLLDNRQRRHRVGYEVVTPLKLSDSEQHVLVNRGWVAAPTRRDVLPEIRTPAGEITLEGVVLRRFPRILRRPDDVRGVVRQTVDIAAFAAQSGLRLQPYALEQHSPAADGLVREWLRPDAGVEKHESYALQWYSLAALAAVLGVVFSLRRVAPR